MHKDVTKSIYPFSLLPSFLNCGELVPMFSGHCARDEVQPGKFTSPETQMLKDL